tara:strand:+ start:1002 stop:1772 length:771 start_codon:yes stop_codon:yes gene_type:complete
MGRKIALLLHGLVSGRNSKNRIVGGREATEAFRTKLIEKYDNVDVFFHGWKPDLTRNVNRGIDHAKLEQELVEAYRPVDYIFEDLKEYPYMNASDWTQNMCSLFYSWKQVNDLKKKHEENNKFKYDIVIHSRFDMTIEYLPDLEHLKPDFIYFTHRNRLQILDSWFIGSSELMDLFGEMYDAIPHLYPIMRSKGMKHQMLNHQVIEHYLKEKEVTDKLVMGLMKGGPTFSNRGKCGDQSKESEWRPDPEKLAKYLE